MSKLVLQELARKASGVSYEESLKATNLTPSLYERIGKEAGFQKLSQLFYDSVYDGGDYDDVDDDSWFRGIFASSTKREAVDNQYRFLVQTFGGPDLYRQKKEQHQTRQGCGRHYTPRLVGRHAAYGIGPAAAERWVWHMRRAVMRHERLQNDDIARIALLNYFAYTAHYLAVASEYMRPDQLSGGTQMDEGRVW